MVNEYTCGAGLPGGIGGLLKLNKSGTPYSYLFDGKGNVTALLTASAGVAATYQYDPFGAPVGPANSLSQPMQFSTKPYDEQTGLSYYGYRFYAPGIGRWMTRDPIGERGGINLYGFVGNNPVNRIDPFGLDWIYHQSTGRICHQPSDAAGGGPPEQVGEGYSGHGEGLNNPDMQHVEDTGPIPEGTYTIEPQQDNVTQRGRTLYDSMRLAPDADTYNNISPRGGFLIHGGNMINRISSRGCIVTPLGIRNRIGNSGDNILRVVP